VILLPTLGNLASAITSLAGPVLASLNGGLMVTATALDEFASIVESVGDLLRGDASEAADEWTGKAQRRLVDRTKESTDATDSFSSALDNALKSLKDTSDTTTEASTVSSIYASQVAYVNTKLAQQKADADGLRQSIFALTAETRSALDAESAYESAVDSVSKVLKDNGAVLRMRNGELDLGSEKSRTAYDALSQLAQQTEDWSAKVLESTGSVTQSNAVLDQGRRKLIDQADALGLTKAQAKALADQLIATPDKVISVKGDLADLKAKLADAEQRLRNARGSKRVDIQGDIANLKRKISQARAELQSLNNVKILINANIAPAGRPSAAFAEGGIVRSAVHALVGEAGPEVVIPLTKPDRARELAEKSGLTGLLGQQAPTPVVNNYITLDGQELRHVARQEIADDQRRRAQGIRR
jgi:hypothetical protein